MRRGEVLGLRWEDVDLEDARASVRQVLTSVNYELGFGEPKTAKGRRVVDLDTTTVAGLRSHRARQAEERLAWGPGYRDLGLVFAREDGSPTHPDALGDVFERITATAGLPRIRLHDLRHTHASLALAGGVHPKVVSERLGHAAVSFTLDVYSHTVPSLQREAADKVAALVFGH
jgi:integrase